MNQDAWLAASSTAGRVLLAVSDGAGSARHSDEGAATAVRAAIRSLATSPEGGEAALMLAMARARRAVDARARRSGLASRHFACTLLLATIDSHQVAGLQVGDGAIVVSNGEATLRLTRPAPSQYAGETVFLTSPEAADATHCTRIAADTITGVALLTDGLEPVATSLLSGEPFSPFFLPLFRYAASPDARQAQLEDLLVSDRIRSRTHDDITLLLAARAS